MTQPDYNLDQHQIIVPPGEIALETKDVNVFYGKKQAT